MNIKQLTYFSRIYELRNMTQAAESLHIAQPALSQQLSLLEEELNSQLFIRKSKGVQPTQQGDLLYRHAQGILRQIEATKALMVNNIQKQQSITGVVSIGLASSTTAMLAIPLIKEVRKYLPSVILEIVTITSNNLPGLLREGKVDFILAPDPHHSPGITIQNLLIEELFFLISPKLIHLKPPIAIKDIADIPLILPSAPNKLRSRIDHAFLIEQMGYNLIAESGTISVLMPAVIEGLAGTILPFSSASKEINNKTIHAYPFKKKMFREIAICYSNQLPLTYATESVINLLINLVRFLIKSGEWKYCQLK